MSDSASFVQEHALAAQAFALEPTMLNHQRLSSVKYQMMIAEQKRRDDDMRAQFESECG